MMKSFAMIILILGLLDTSAIRADVLDNTLAGEVLAEINLARTEPHRYAGFLRGMVGRFQGTLYRMPGSDVLMQTSEGVAAVDEAIRVISRRKPLPVLKWSSGLAAAAAELTREQGETGATGHIGGASHGMQERIEHHGTWQRRIGENIAYGPAVARGIVMQLIIDDGVPDRGHRNNLFNPAFGTAGVACGPHPRFGNLCVIDFAGGFRE